MLAPRLILASSSPRRHELLTQAGYSFVVAPADIDETVAEREDPVLYTVRLALEKAQAVLARSGDGEVIVAADTTVVESERILGKPENAAQAAEMLMSLSGRNHDVVTAWAVLSGSGSSEGGFCRSVVRMRDISWEQARRYAAGGEPLDKAGAYAAQGEGRRFIGAIAGRFDNVIGLPVEPVARALARAGVRPGA